MERFARAALSSLAYKYPHLAPTGEAALLPASEGAANLLVRAGTRGGDVVVKLRAAPGDDGSVESWALARLSEGLGPRLLARTRAVVLRADAARRGELTSLRALDLRVGGVLVMEHMQGSPPAQPLSDDVITRSASAIARLHGARTRVGPRLRTGSAPRALISIARFLTKEIGRASLLDAGSARALSRALSRAEDAASKATRFPRVRALCHGDLRWHNVMLHDGGVRLLDFEHAGIGDPAVDLALMSCRVPLGEHDELRLLDAYLDARRDPTLLDRYFALRELIALIGALAGIHDLCLVERGERETTESPAAYVARRRADASDELARALEYGGVKSSKGVRLAFRPEGRSARAAPKRRALGRCAVDGTASSGKSVLARAIADDYGAPYFNTGAAYRYAALLALEDGLRPERAVDVAHLLERLTREAPRLLDDGGLRVRGARLEEALYVHEIDLVVARFAALPALRSALVPALAPALTPRDAVIEGRDVASVLLPRARHRLFIDAAPRVRAERTLERLGRGLSLGTVQRGIEARDSLDRSRAASPLLVVDGASVVDTTRLSQRAAISRVLALVEGQR